MNVNQTVSPAQPFQIPVLPPLSALRDRRDEIHEHSARMRDEGYRAGLDAGTQEIARLATEHRRALDRLATATAALESATADLDRRDRVTIAEVERQAIDLAIALAAEIIGRELVAVDRPVLDALHRATGLLPDRGRPVLSVHPDDADTVREIAASGEIRWTASAEIVADPAIERGGCVVEVGPCRIDAQIGTSIERLRAALG